jgi:hypothetical protein
LKEQHSYLDINPIPHPSHWEGKTEKIYFTLMEALTKSLITDFSSLWEESVMGLKKHSINCNAHDKSNFAKNKMENRQAQYYLN